MSLFKTSAWIAAFFGATSLMAMAGSLPRGVYKLSELEQAKSAAKIKGEPLIFVCTEMNSTCGLCRAATEDIFKSFRSRGTLIVFDSKTDQLSDAPEVVGKMYRNPFIGKTIPVVIVTTADGAKEIKGYSYAQLDDGEAAKAARDLRKTLEAAAMTAGGVAEAGGTTTDAKPELLAEAQTWQNADGKAITAAVKKVDESSVTFVLPGGKTVDYPLAKLSAASREKLLGLKE
jgi:hypothetical protein